MDKLTLEDVGKFWIVGILFVIGIFMTIILSITGISFIQDFIETLQRLGLHRVMKITGIGMLMLVIPTLIGMVVIRVYNWYDENYRRGLKNG